MHLIWEMITHFTEQFRNEIKGKYDPRRKPAAGKNGITGGAMIKFIFEELYKDLSTNNFKASKDYSDKDIERSITLHQGDSIPGFPSIDAFLYLINPQLE